MSHPFRKNTLRRDTRTFPANVPNAVEFMQRNESFFKHLAAKLREDRGRTHPTSAARKRVDKEIKDAEISAGLWQGRRMEAEEDAAPAVVQIPRTLFKALTGEAAFKRKGKVFHRAA